MIESRSNLPSASNLNSLRMSILSRSLKSTRTLVAEYTGEPCTARQYPNTL